ncbi:hypothetical protein KR093_010640, partial [Drosophila rubida]
IVLDVGCRSGLLSYLACEAGAARVYAVGNPTTARYVTKALAGSEKAEVFLAPRGDISQIRLPCAKVDIIVSEWMGYGLLADSLYLQVTYARDKYLVPGGYIIPSHVSLYIRGICGHPRHVDEENECTVQMVDEYVDASTLMTHKYLLKTVDLKVVNKDEEFIKTQFKLRTLKSGIVDACLLHMEVASVGVDGTVQKLFSNSPEKLRTYMKQTVLFLDEDSMEVTERDTLGGRFSLVLSNYAPRGVEYSLAMYKYIPYNL